VAQRFVKLMDGDQVWDLIKTNHHAFILLTVIALRARSAASNINDGLKPGEALIGDYYNYDMTKKTYRCAKRALERLHLAAFRGTPRGTVATITAATIYDMRFFIEGTPEGTLKGTPQGTAGAPNRDIENLEKSREAAAARAREAFPDRDEWREAYAELVGCPELSGLTKAGFMRALEFGKPKDLMEAAKACAVDAGGENSGVDHPGKYWRAYCVRQCDMEGGKSGFGKKSAPPSWSVVGEAWRVGADRVAGW